ncbi:hypothetical protein BDW60DRAFT_213465 [Aspergillus nidulans var. acristatus]
MDKANPSWSMRNTAKGSLGDLLQVVSKICGLSNHFVRLCPFRRRHAVQLTDWRPIVSDPEKKKYFAIQANHKSAPGSQYSQDVVKRKRADEEVVPIPKRQRKARLVQRYEKEKIKRATCLQNPLIQVQREVGSLPVSRLVEQEQRGLAYASQFRRKQLHQFEPWPDQYTIKHVVRNSRSGILIASGHRGGESSVSATMDSGPNGDSFLAPRMLPDPDEGGDYRWPPFFSHPIRIHTTSSLWCSAPSPTSDIPRFAVGTSDGLYTLEGFGSYWTLSKKPFPNDKSSGNPKKRRTDSSHALITAVEWLSSDVIAAGLKDSTIFLHDVRSGGSATRLQHPHAVTKIRKLDPYRIVVAGINSLQMYDIRYPPNNLQRNPNPNKSHHTSTRPYLTFSTNYPEINITPDFDISPELGLLASASPTDRDSTVQLYSLRTGEQVASPLTRYRYRDSIRSVCFESGNQSAAHGSQTPSLLVCSEATVDEWKW